MTQVHVVIPAYNAAWSISDTIRSILGQSLGDFRATLVDDGSTEDMSAALASALGHDQRFSIVRQPNGGLAAARNRGLAEADAPFVAFIDSDDIWHPAFLSTLVAALKDQPRAPFAYCHSHRFDTANRLIPASPWGYVPRHDLVGLLTLNTVASGSASVFRTEAVRAAGGFDTSLRQRGAEGAEDWKLSLRLAAQEPPVLVPAYLAGYRLGSASMSQGNPARQLLAVRTVIDDILTEVPTLPAQTIRNARTALNGWLLQAFLAQGAHRTVLSLLAESYLRNPGWILSRELRTIHAIKIGTLFADRGERRPLADLTESDGQRPFDFLR